jgi:hypothetical protein
LDFLGTAVEVDQAYTGVATFEVMRRVEARVLGVEGAGDGIYSRAHSAASFKWFSTSARLKTELGGTRRSSAIAHECIM